VGIVYQYTDIEAFQKIVEAAKLWATDFRYLNDWEELVYTWVPFVGRLEELATQPGEYSEAYRAQLEALRLMNAIDLMAFDDAVLVACFTELPDAISQWSRYGANGRGVALGFDSDKIGVLKVPQYCRYPDGNLEPVTATEIGTDGGRKEIELRWNAFLQKVNYGDAARDRVVDGLLDMVRQCSGKNDDARHFNTKVANCIWQTHALIHRLPLVKHSAFEDEQEHRLTITEHFSGQSRSQRTALSSLGESFKALPYEPLRAVDTKFRTGGATMFKPYVEMPFERQALVEVVTGPAVKHQLVEATIRRMLERNGFPETRVIASKLPYQP